ncbi:MAG: hypothetical protein H7282_06740 [Cytophagaceae bacterium]|nr:hypothetical protein [Cytophagaceae bacterium]
MKERLLKAIDRKELFLFVLYPSKYQTIVSSDNEFHYLGDVYDLVHVKKIGGKYHCWFWLDQEESDLDHQLSLLVSEAMGEDSENEEDENALNDFFELLYFFERDTFQLFSQDVIDRKEYLHPINYSFFYSSFLIDPPESRLV